ncbi:MAG: terminase [Alphaproteobacteria bacterium]
MASATKLTPKKREQFLAALAAGATVTRAAKDTSASRQAWYGAREHDTAFAEAWDEAVKIGNDALEDEAVRRGAVGVRRAVYQGGKRVGFVREYSDALLMLVLKARRPEKFGRRTSVDHAGKGGSQGEASDARERLASRIGRLAAGAGEVGDPAGPE